MAFHFMRMSPFSVCGTKVLFKNGVNQTSLLSQFETMNACTSEKNTTLPSTFTEPQDSPQKLLKCMAHFPWDKNTVSEIKCCGGLKIQRLPLAPVRTLGPHTGTTLWSSVNGRKWALPGRSRALEPLEAASQVCPAPLCCSVFFPSTYRVVKKGLHPRSALLQGCAQPRGQTTMD